MRIAHISDMHLRHHLFGTSAGTRRLSRRMPHLFADAVDRLQSEKIDLIVVSGDLTDYPLYSLYDSDTRSRGRDDVRIIRDALDASGIRYAVVRGNHDHPDTVSEVFGSQPDDAHMCDHRVIVFHDDEVTGNVPQRMGSEREKFLNALRDEDETPQIHLQHYLVWPEKREGYPHSYREAQHLRDEIVRSERVRLVLSGHYHPGIEPFREGNTWFATAPAFAEPPHRFFIYELDGADLTWSKIALGENRTPSPAVFLDRDGCINPQPSYRTGPEDFTLIPGAADAIRRLKDAGYVVIVVSNQTCVGYGWVTAETVARVMERMSALLREEGGIDVDGVYACHHSPNAVLPEYRHPDPPDLKPNPGMLLRAADDLALDLRRSFMVGDNLSDLETGQRAGTGRILVRTGSGAEAAERVPDGLADAVTRDIAGAADWILSHPR